VLSGVCENEELKQTFRVRKLVSGAPNLTIARFLSFISTSEWHAQFCDVLVVGGEVRRRCNCRTSKGGGAERQV
jgi:hypothetical protein